MEPIIWELYICNPDDIERFENGELEWKDVRKTKIRALVDTDTSRTLIFQESIKELGVRISKRRISVAGLCCATSLCKALVGVALEVGMTIVTAREEVLVVLEHEFEEFSHLRKHLMALNAEAILGRQTLDSLSVLIDPKTHKPLLVPVLIL